MEKSITYNIIDGGTSIPVPIPSWMDAEFNKAHAIAKMNGGTGLNMEEVYQLRIKVGRMKSKGENMEVSNLETKVKSVQSIINERASRNADKYIQSLENFMDGNSTGISFKTCMEKVTVKCGDYEEQIGEAFYSKSRPLMKALKSAIMPKFIKEATEEFLKESQREINLKGTIQDLRTENLSLEAKIRKSKQPWWITRQVIRLNNWRKREC